MLLTVSLLHLRIESFDGRLWDTAELGITQRTQRKLERQQALCGSGEQKTLLNHLLNSFLLYLSPYFFPALLAPGDLCYDHQ